VTTSGGSPQDAVDWVDALVDLARSAREDQFPDVLLTVCETVRRITGFQDVVFNLYRRAWDDFEAVIVVGSDEARHALLGSFTSRQAADTELFRPEFEEAPGVFLVPGESDAWEQVGGSTYTPEASGVGDGSWGEEDGLLVRLQVAGETIGFLSVDKPSSGRRPTPESYRLLRAVCSHAEQVFELTQVSTRAAVTARRGEALIGADDTFAQCSSEKEVLAVLADLVPSFGFDRAAAYLAAADGLDLACVVGFPSEAAVAASVPVARVEALTRLVEDRAGTYLTGREAIHGRSAGEAVSARNGRGPAAWHDHALLVPARAADGSLHALLAIEDPADRLLPNASVLRLLRILVDRAAGALDAIVARAQLAHLASHDALTGLRNRRALEDRSCLPSGPGAVLVCDLDHFKQVNDSHGHRIGDEVLARFAGVLTTEVRQGDIAVRLGGGSSRSCSPAWAKTVPWRWPSGSSLRRRRPSTTSWRHP
jgi:hypothetical protein